MKLSLEFIMLGRMCRWGVYILLFPALFFAAESDLKARMRTDLEVIRNTFQSQYAPIEWKAAHIGWYLDNEILKAQSKIDALSPITVKDYQRILKQFFDEIQDYHVNISFFSTEVSQLPFLIKSANGRHFFAIVDQQGLPKTAAGIKVGDELIEFDGKPASQAMKEFLDQEFNCGKTPTDQAYGNLFFTVRLGALGHVVPKGPISIKVKHKASGTVKTYSLKWSYQKEEVKNMTPPHLPKTLAAAQAVLRAGNELSFPLNKTPFFQKSMLAPVYQVLKGTSTILASEGIGPKESFLPTLGKKLWQADLKSQFHAYLFETPDKRKLGYIRIPHYMGSDKHIDQFKKIISKFQQESDALVIDQLNNPGGSVFYMYSLASMLSDQPLVLPKHRISLTQREVMFAVEMLPTFETIQSDEDAKQVIGDFLDGYPVNLETAKRITQYLQDIVNEWNTGATFTKPLPLWGVAQIEPHSEVRYTKPILMLINELAFSCGDFLPAILQDNNRAKLFGARTAGAGGFVLGLNYPNLFGIQNISYTGSIVHRVDDSVIENLGVTPDIPYSLNEQDLTQQYSSYVKAVHEAIKGIK